MSAPALRPLRVGEILDAGIKLYTGNARSLMRLTALVVVPFQILSAVVLLSTVSSADQVPRGFSTVGTARTGDHAASLGASLVLGVTGWIVGLLSTAVCVKAVSDIYLDQPLDPGASLRFAARRLGSLVWLEIFLTALLMLAFLALVIPGIWLYAAAGVATPALLVEGCRGGRALRRSLQLVRGRWWPVAGVLLVAGLMTALIASVIEGVLIVGESLLAGGSLTGSSGSVVLAVFAVSLAGAASSILTRPFMAAVVTVLYYDLRVRREGYDVELLAEQLGLEPAALPAGALAGGGLAGGLPAGARAGWEGGLGGEWGPDSVGQPGGPPFWPPPPGWSPQS
jgi:hypothetical protein